MSYILDALRKVERERQGMEQLTLDFTPSPADLLSRRGWITLIALGLSLNMVLMTILATRPHPSPATVLATPPMAALIPAPPPAMPTPDQQPVRQSTAAHSEPRQAAAPKAKLATQSPPVNSNPTALLPTNRPTQTNQSDNPLPLSPVSPATALLANKSTKTSELDTILLIPNFSYQSTPPTSRPTKIDKPVDNSDHSSGDKVEISAEDRMTLLRTLSIDAYRKVTSTLDAQSQPKNQSKNMSDTNLPSSDLSVSRFYSNTPIFKNGGIDLSDKLIIEELRNIPTLKLDVHVHSNDGTQRLVIINGRRYQEGDRLEEGPRLEAITTGGVMLRQGRRPLELPVR